MHNVRCPASVALNGKTGSIYTISCIGLMKTCKFDGSNEEILSRKITEGVVTGIAMYNDQFYWTAMADKAYVKFTEMNDTRSHPYFEKRFAMFSDVAIIHPSNQPSGTTV